MVTAFVYLELPNGGLGYRSIQFKEPGLSVEQAYRALVAVVRDGGRGGEGREAVKWRSTAAHLWPPDRARQETRAWHPQPPLPGPRTDVKPCVRCGARVEGRRCDLCGTMIST